MRVKVRGPRAMRAQSREADLAQEPGGLCEVVTGRRGRHSLGPVGGNSRPRSVGWCGRWRGAEERTSRGPISKGARTCAFMSGTVGGAQAC